MPDRSAMPGPLFSLDASEHKSGSRQPGWLRKRGCGEGAVRRRMPWVMEEARGDVRFDLLCLCIVFR